jgi:RHS repeat-associated protein
VKHYSSSSGGVPSGTLLLEEDFTYDVFGNRLSDTLTQSGSTTVTRFAYDQDGNAWADLNSSNQLVTRRLYLNGVDQLFARIDASTGTGYFYMTDNQGSVRAILDAATNTIVDRIDYDAYGNILSETATSYGDRYKYTGGQFDSATGLELLGARYYEPSTHIWITQDPLGFGGGQSNLYEYVGDDPTDGTDPSGLSDQPSGQTTNHSLRDYGQSGFEVGSQNPNVSFSLVQQALTGAPMEVDSYRAFARGFYAGQLAARPDELARRQAAADALEAQVQAMEQQRARAWYNPLGWVLGSHAMSEEEESLRKQISHLQSPLWTQSGDPVEGWDYAVWGARFNTNHAVRSLPASEDPIVWYASAGTIGIPGGIGRGLGAFASREGLKQIGKGVALGMGVDAADQGIRIAQGRQKEFSVSELATSGILGGVLVPASGVFGGLGKALAVMGLASALDAVGEDAPFLAAFRATISVFGPTIARRLSNIGQKIRPLLSNKGTSPLGNEGPIANTLQTEFQQVEGGYVDAAGEALDGTYKVVVMPDGKIRYAPSWAGTHAEIAGGSKVQSAGEITFNNGKAAGANITSGHFQTPVGEGYNTILDQAIRNNGYKGPSVMDTHK